jgi:anti-sigma regulatory factor (Ser/Thr protein kinase)/CheY-like chemotaxis protein
MGSSAVTEQASTALLVGPPDDLEALFPVAVDRADSPATALIRLASKRYDVVVVNHTAEDEVTNEQISYLRAAKAMRPDAKLIVLVTHTTTAKVIEALREGTFAYFSRPFNPAAVQEAIALAFALPGRNDGIEVVSAEPDFITVRLRCCIETADRLALFLKELPSSLSEEERGHLSAALREMLMNAIEHGGKLDRNEWVQVSRVRTQRTIVYHIKDPGEGFSRKDLKHAAVTNPPDDPTAHVEIRESQNMRPGGFGMLIASELVDEVIYNQRGNEVILIKHLD